MINIANVLVATDFGEASVAALAYGREFARTFGARLHVLHVVQSSLMSTGPDELGVDFRRMQADLVDAGRNALERVVTREDREQLDAVTVVRIGNSPAFEIVRCAREAAIDLIIMGTHGRGFMGHFLMGSIAEKIVRSAPCPVLTIRHPEHEFILPDALQAVEAKRS